MIAMHLGLTIAVALTVLLADLDQARAVRQAVIFPSFPYCACSASSSSIPSPTYSLGKSVAYRGGSTYCFKVQVAPITSCAGGCCGNSQLNKLEVNIKSGCVVPGAKLSATVNGLPTKVAPFVTKAPSGPAGSTVLRLTQLGLNRTTANGTEICITLGTNKAGNGCTTLEQLCVPPAGATTPGECSAGLFDASGRCCPVFKTTQSPCRVCVYVSRAQEVPGSYPPPFGQFACDQISQLIAADVTREALSAGAIISTPFNLSECRNTLLEARIKVCGEFASNSDGQKLAPVADGLVSGWYDAGFTGGGCGGLTRTVAMAGDGDNTASLPPSCVNAGVTTACGSGVQAP